MISLVACGHTLGGVRNTDFPTIVPGAATELVLKKFDGTNAYDDSMCVIFVLIFAWWRDVQLDFSVAEYLNGTTIDPMITISNSTLQSDLRVFSSDGNVTMKR